jgi:hypothetical protein
MKYDQRVIIRFLCKERIWPEDIHARLEGHFGDPPYRDRSVRRGYQYVRQGREDLHNKVRCGRPSIDFLDIRILALLDEQPFHSAYSIAELLCVSPAANNSSIAKSAGLPSSENSNSLLNLKDTPPKMSSLRSVMLNE